MNQPEEITLPAETVELVESTALLQVEQPLEERQTIVHCLYRPHFFGGDYIRIWPSTYLIDQETKSKTALLHAFNICMAPHWMAVPASGIFRFTLIFGGLPASCKIFNLEEIIAEEGGFLVKNIRRNEQDVYTVWLD